ncbi:MAG: ketopantoate reductase family protein [Acidimicrobiales bacterium]
MAKIAVVGAGAMGSVYAGLLAEGGHEVWAVDTWREHVEAINAGGLRVQGASGDRTVAIRATTDAREVGPCDLVIIATKAAQVEAAAEAAKALLGPDTPVISIQNGLGGPERAAKVLGEERVVLGVVGGFGASITAPGHAHHNGWDQVRLGELAGPVSPRVERLAEIWRSGGFNVLTFDDPHQLVWEKLIVNCAFSGPSAVTGLRVGELLADPDGWTVSSSCAREAWTLARALGIAVDIADPVAHVRAFGSKMPDARPSMLLDHLAGRRSEIDAINGAVAERGATAGVATPYNTVVAALVRAKEHAFPLR